MEFNQAYIERIMSIDGFSKKTNELMYHIPEVEDFGINTTTTEDEVTDATGSPIAIIESAKQAEFSGNASFITFPLLAAQSGTEVVKGGVFPRYQELTISSTGTAVLAKEAIGTEGAEIGTIYIRENDGTKGEAITQAASATDGKFAYDASSKTITVDTALAGKTVMVFYNYQSDGGQIIENSAENFTEPCVLKVRALIRDVCQNNYNIMTLTADNAKLASAFDLTLGKGEKHPFTYKVMPAYCGTSGKLLFTVYVPNSDDYDEE